jgi:SPP1 gp7 family putative phage head morphogenesis protein
MRRRGSERSANEVLLDRSIRHSLLTERFKAHEARRIARILDREVLPDLATRLAGRLENIATRGFDTGPKTTARLQFLYRDLRSFFVDLTGRIRAETEPALFRFATSHAEAQARDILGQVRGVASVATPSASTIRAAVLQRPFDSLLLREHWGKRMRSMREGVEAQVRMGLIQGEAPPLIVKRVRSVWPGERRKVASTVRTAVAHAQTQARQAVFEENDNLLEGVMWVATLDVSTCPRCALLDGNVFEVDEGPRPPLHRGPCRCSPVPVLKSAKDLGGTRASMDGQVPDKLTFSEWIEDQDVERQNEVFGVGRARLFREGRIGLEDMVDAAGNTLSLDRLVALSER